MDATRAFIERLGALNRVIGRVGVVIAACLIGLMTTIVILGVFFRYVLNDSITWAEDVALIMMVTTAFLVAPYAYRTGANVAIEMLVDMLPRHALRATRVLTNVLILWLIYRYFLESIGLVSRGWGIRVNTVPIPWAYPYMAVPVSFVALALVGIEHILRDVWAFATGSTKADLPHLAPREPE